MLQLGRSIRALAIAAAPILAGCDSRSTAPGSASPPVKYVYYTHTVYGFDTLVRHYDTVTSSHIVAVPLPVTDSSSPAFSLASPPATGYGYFSTILIDSRGNLWVLERVEGGVPMPRVLVFATPLTPTSQPTATYTLPDSMLATSMALDESGALWVTAWQWYQSPAAVHQFAGTFLGSTRLAPSRTILATGCLWPERVIFDASGNLYLSCQNAFLASAIAVLLKSANFAGIDHYIGGVGVPAAMAFDSRGNLYAGSNLPAPDGGVCMFTSGNLLPGASFDFCNSQRMGAGFFPTQFAFDSTGDLYAADCTSLGSHVFVLPTGSQPFSPSLVPTAAYSDRFLSAASGCIGGVAIH